MTARKTAVVTKETVEVVEKKVRYGSSDWIKAASFEDLKKFARTQKIDVKGDVNAVRATIKRVLAKRRSTAAKARGVKPMVEEPAVEVPEVEVKTMPKGSVQFEQVGQLESGAVLVEPAVVEKPVEVDERTKFEMSITPEQIEVRAQELEDQEAWRYVVANLAKTLPKLCEQLDTQDKKIEELSKGLDSAPSTKWVQAIEGRLNEQAKKVETLKSSLWEYVLKQELEDAVAKAMAGAKAEWADAVRGAILDTLEGKKRGQFLEWWDQVIGWLNEKPNKGEEEK